jgi:hypothetical protein
MQKTNGCQKPIQRGTEAKKNLRFFAFLKNAARLEKIYLLIGLKPFFWNCDAKGNRPFCATKKEVWNRETLFVWLIASLLLSFAKGKRSIEEESRDSHEIAFAFGNPIVSANKESLYSKLNEHNFGKGN